MNMPEIKLKLHMDIPTGHACCNPDCKYGCNQRYYSQEEVDKIIQEAQRQHITYARQKESDLDQLQKELKAQCCIRRVKLSSTSVKLEPCNDCEWCKIIDYQFKKLRRGELDA